MAPTGHPERGMNPRTLQARELGRHLANLKHEGTILLKVTDPSWPDSAIFSLAPERVRTIPVRNYTWAKNGAWPSDTGPVGAPETQDYILLD